MKTHETEQWMTPSLKVVLVTPGLTPHFGGSAVSEASLVASLQTKCDVQTLCRFGHLDKEFAHSFGIKHVREYRPFEVVSALGNRDHWMRKIIAAADVLHLNGHWKWENYFFALLCAKVKVPYILHPRGMLVMNQRRPQLKRLFNRLLGNVVLQNAARVIALSHFEVGQFKQHPIRKERIAVIPNGITPPEKRNLVEAQRPPFFLYLGRLEARKNLLFLVDAFARYRSLGGKKQLCLVGPTERNYDQAILEKAKNLGVLSDVLIPGASYGEGKWRWMAEATVVLYPTLEEVFGRVPFEALSIGTPVLIPDESGSAEYLQSCFPAGLYRHQSMESLVEGFFRFDQPLSDSILKQLQESEAWVKTRLSWTRVLEEVLQLYASVLSEHQTVQPREKLSRLASL